MVDGQDSIETSESNADERRGDEQSTTDQAERNGNGEQRSREVHENQENVTPTTTISTIAVQSGDTRLVIALLQVRHILFAFRRIISVVLYIHQICVNT